MVDPVTRPQLGRLYLCTPDRVDLAEFVAAVIAGGVDMVQLRDKDLTAREVLQRGAMTQEVCRAAGVPFFINDRPDLAMALEADGVHVGQTDSPPALVRQVVGSRPLVGLSTHTPDHLAHSADQPVDYVSAGPVVATPTKPGRPGVGLGYIAHAVECAPHPFYVTGGVAPDTIGPLLDVGATRFVVVRWLTEAVSPGDAEARARRLHALVDTQ